MPLQYEPMIEAPEQYEPTREYSSLAEFFDADEALKNQADWMNQLRTLHSVARVAGVALEDILLAQQLQGLSSQAQSMAAQSAMYAMMPQVAYPPMMGGAGLMGQLSASGYSVPPLDTGFMQTMGFPMHAVYPMHSTVSSPLPPTAFATPLPRVSEESASPTVEWGVKSSVVPGSQ
jgi:hypothetical protein